ncbi:MAG: dTDP-3-amino-3,6-dideoxy-alpha-D-galactopyranose transaminase [Bacteroidota bacterium]|jgi:dTDP-4-amino-4,6-dideoxygalactose transaminase
MIPFLNLQALHAPFHEAYQLRLQKILDKGHFILGEEVAQFETAFAAFCGAKHAIGVGNGLDAITLTLRAYQHLGKLKPGDGVIVPANTFIATLIGIREAGLVPILVEPDPDTFLLSADGLEPVLDATVKAIIVVHLYGQLAPMEGLTAFAEKHDLLIVEDAAQGHGLPKIGNHTQTYSFYPGKNLGALGDGGAVVTNDDALCKLLKQMRNYGSAQKYHNEVPGINSRLDTLQAAFLSVRLPYILEENEQRRTLAKRYSAGISNSKIQTPKVDDYQRHMFHLYVIRSKERDALQQYLLEKGIETLIHYPIPPHQQGAFPELIGLQLPLTEQLHREVLSLPMSPLLTIEEVDYIIQTLNAF